MKLSESQSAGLRATPLPRLAAAYLIDANHSHQHARLHHLHETELELLFVDTGAGEYMVAGRTYQVSAGDLVVCNAGELHGEAPAARRGMRTYCIALTGITLPGLPDGHLIPTDSDAVLSCGLLAEPIGQMMRLAYLFSADLPHLQPLADSLARTLLLMAHEIAVSRAWVYIPDECHTEDGIARRARRYLDAHYRSGVTLRTLSEALRVNEYYLSHVFKQAYDVPPMQYAAQRRIGEAQSLLIDTDLPVSDIADRLGYSSLCHFNAMFKKYVGLPPGKYRHTFRVMEE